MSSINETKFHALTALIKEVKPSVADLTITLEDSIVENLGLDSLDVLQLIRKIRRNMGAEFDLDSWSQGAKTHRRSVQSVLDAIRDPVDA